MMGEKARDGQRRRRRPHLSNPLSLPRCSDSLSHRAGSRAAATAAASADGMVAMASVGAKWQVLNKLAVPMAGGRREREGEEHRRRRRGERTREEAEAAAVSCNYQE